MRILVHRPSLAGTADEFTPLLSRGDCIYINKSTGYADIAPPNPDVGVIDGDALEGTGLDELLVRLEAQITERFSASGDAGITRARHKDCISRAEDAVSAGISMLGDMPELASENIRTALSALEGLAGRADIEQVFDRIFSRFCIGK
jgi:tRNA modification GTPase